MRKFVNRLYVNYNLPAFSLVAALRSQSEQGMTSAGLGLTSVWGHLEVTIDERCRVKHAYLYMPKYFRISFRKVMSTIHDHKMTAMRITLTNSQRLLEMSTVVASLAMFSLPRNSKDAFSYSVLLPLLGKRWNRKMGTRIIQINWNREQASKSPLEWQLRNSRKHRNLAQISTSPCKASEPQDDGPLNQSRKYSRLK